jgi:hypothetical protein
MERRIELASLRHCLVLETQHDVVAQEALEPAPRPRQTRVVERLVRREMERLQLSAEALLKTANAERALSPLPVMPAAFQT